MENKLSFINELRGIAIILVVAVHTAKSIHNLNPMLQTTLNFGQMGVQLFFLLSAFTLCLSSEKKVNETVFTFYLRRFFRIAPLYYFGLIIYHFISYQTQVITNLTDYNFKNTLANIIFIHSFYPPATNNIVPGGWSIGTEMTFYFLFPFILSLYKKISPYKWLLFLTPFLFFLASYLLSKLLEVQYSEFISNNRFYYFNIINQLPVFLVGMSLFFLLKTKTLNFNKILSISISLTLLLLCIYILNFNFNPALLPFIASLFFVFLFIFFKNSNKKIQLLNKIGTYSFSIYIFHYVFAIIVSKQLSILLKDYFNSNLIFLVCFMVTLIITYLISSITFRFIETKGIILGNKLALKIKPKNG